VPRHSETTLSAIKNGIDIIALAGEYLPSLRRAGSRYKAICPWHDDHNPSLELNPERQSFKCWSCGVGGDIFDFVQNIEHVDFPEALRMLADRAGVALENAPSTAAQKRGPSKSDLFEVNAWAEEVFANALFDSAEVRAYLEHRGLTLQSAMQFRLGYAPDERDWLMVQARRKRFGTDVLELAGLISQSPDAPGIWRERFRGRLIFPIHDERGRTLGFGGRILPAVEQKLVTQGKSVAKYLNSPETLLFHKRTLVYAADRARIAVREAGWVGVVEGYTDVIAAHQVGVCNVVGTLGTALGEDHLRALQRLTDKKVVLVFDGDDAGQSAADRALEFFLQCELDVRVLSLPANLDPCDYILREGAEAFRNLAEQAVDPLAYLLSRAAVRFDLSAADGAHRAADWLLGILSSVPDTNRLGPVKKAKVIDTLSQRLRVPVETLYSRLRQVRRPAVGSRRAGVPVAGIVGASASSVNAPPNSGEPPPEAATGPIRQDELDPIDVEFIRIILNEPSAIARLFPRIGVSTLRDAPLRAILQACYDLQGEGVVPNSESLMVRIEDSAIRGLVAGLIAPSAVNTLDPAPFSDRVRPAPWQERLENMLTLLDERERGTRLNDLKKAKEQTDPDADPEAYRAIELEYRRLLTSGRTRKT
jgi:DNA primase